MNEHNIVMSQINEFIHEKVMFISEIIEFISEHVAVMSEIVVFTNEQILFISELDEFIDDFDKGSNDFCLGLLNLYQKSHIFLLIITDKLTNLMNLYDGFYNQLFL